jgi:hypothetical protein
MGTLNHGKSPHQFGQISSRSTETLSNPKWHCGCARLRSAQSIPACNPLLYLVSQIAAQADLEILKMGSLN